MTINTTRALFPSLVSLVGLAIATTTSAAPTVASDYPTLDELKTTLQAWAAAHPDIAEFRVWANSNGYDQFYLRVSSAVTSGATLPSVLIDAATHGDEVISTATVMGVLKSILDGYGTDSVVNDVVATRDMYFAPALCADGYARGSRLVEGRDPNRSYPYPGNMSNVPTTCVRNAMDLFEDVGFNATINYHASGRMILLPWGYTRQPFNDGNMAAPYKTLGAKLASLTGYTWGQIPDTVGYTAPGGSSDWYHIRGKELGFHTAAFAVEVGRSKRPPANEIEPEVARNREAILTFAKEGPTLLAGPSLDYHARLPEPAWPIPAGPSPWFVPGEE